MNIEIETPKSVEIEMGMATIYPPLEDLVITPSDIEQNFKSKKYGYNNVKVKAVEVGYMLEVKETTINFTKGASINENEVIL